MRMAAVVRLVLPSCLLVPALILLGCTAASAPQVIAADGALCDITRRLAADALRVGCLLAPSDDPHQLQLSPEQSRQIRAAQLVLINGYGLTPSLERLPEAVKVAELAVPDSPELDDRRASPTSSQGAEASDSHAQEASGEHAHRPGDRDPHVWHDPRQASAVVAVVRARLQQLEPVAAPAIAARSRAMQASLIALHGWNQRQFATVPPPRTLATEHRAFASLARAYQLRELALLDADSASDSLRPAAMTAVVQHLRQLRPGALFSEQQPPGRALVRIGDLSGVPIASRPLLADNGGDNLMVTLTANTCLIVEGLGGRCDRTAAAALVQQWNAIR